MTTKQGYAELQQWSRSLGEIRAFGIEGTGSYGAGVARFLTSRGYAIVEVNRPDRVNPAVGRGRATPPTQRWPLVPYLPE